MLKWMSREISCPTTKKKYFSLGSPSPFNDCQLSSVSPPPLYLMKKS